MSVTDETGFTKMDGVPLFNVAAGIEKRRAIQHASCVVNCVQSRLHAAVETPLEGDEAWMLAHVLEEVEAILGACE
jgi:hypothetical protein